MGARDDDARGLADKVRELLEAIAGILVPAPQPVPVPVPVNGGRVKRR